MNCQHSMFVYLSPFSRDICNICHICDICDICNICNICDICDICDTYDICLASYSWKIKEIILQMGLEAERLVGDEMKLTIPT